MAGNNNIRDKAKLLWIKSMKTIGNTAANIANNTKFRVDEMTLQNRRRELSVDLSNTVYAMWLKGTEFPPELTKILEELQKLDDRLNDMRAEKYDQSNPSPARSENDESSAESSERMEETAGNNDVKGEEPDEEGELSEAITEASPFLRTEIDGCFDHGTSVDKMAEKVNSSLDQLTDKIRSFSSETSEKDGN